MFKSNVKINESTIFVNSTKLKSYLHYSHADYCPHLGWSHIFIVITTFLAVVPPDLYQVYVDPGNLRRIPNWILYLIYESSLFVPMLISMDISSSLVLILLSYFSPGLKDDFYLHHPFFKDSRKQYEMSKVYSNSYIVDALYIYMYLW